MRDDQISRLQALSESLGEVVIHEVDPRNWPGAEKLPSALTQDTKGFAAAATCFLQRGEG
nr:hypothetical protein [uncultured Pseudomonas sp.]